MIIVLDTGVLSGITNPNARSAEIKAMKQWAAALRAAGHTFVTPAIADYEVRRELIRRNATASLAALDTFCTLAVNRYLPISDSVLRRAAALWASARSAGKPTAPEAALDGDVILCAHVLEAGFAPGSYQVATTNTKHLSRFVDAAEWRRTSPASHTALPTFQ